MVLPSDDSLRYFPDIVVLGCWLMEKHLKTMGFCSSPYRDNWTWVDFSSSGLLKALPINRRDMDQIHPELNNEFRIPARFRDFRGLHRASSANNSFLINEEGLPVDCSSPLSPVPWCLLQPASVKRIKPHPVIWAPGYSTSPAIVKIRRKKSGRTIPIRKKALPSLI